MDRQDMDAQRRWNEVQNRGLNRDVPPLRPLRVPGMVGDPWLFCPEVREVWRDYRGRLRARVRARTQKV